MGRAEQYRHLADEVRAMAERERSPVLRAEWEMLAETYIRLAAQSEGAPAGATYDPIQDMLDHARKRG